MSAGKIIRALLRKRFILRNPVFGCKVVLVFRKGQAAMEYLMTYGWALLVIVIAIGVLLILNPFKAQNQCLFEQPGLVCNQPTNPVVDTDGQLYMTLTNGFQNAIVVKGIVCTASRDQQENPDDLDAEVPSQGTLKVAPSETGVTCKDVDGNDISATAGSDFTGKLWVWYKNKDDPISYPVKTLVANIVSKIEKG